MLKLGIIGQSNKENEKRLPIHPKDFKNIDEKYRNLIYIDKNYGFNFGYKDSELSPYVGGIIDKSDIYKICDIILILKFTYDDYLNVKPGTICWGWHHLMQNKKHVDIIIQKHLTIISIEEMYLDNKYILQDNRIIAGYSSVMHALQLKGMTGYLNFNKANQPTFAVLSYGSVGIGAVDGLLALGYKNIDVYTKRPTHIVENKRDNVNYKNYPKSSRWFDVLCNYDVIINCVLQDPYEPIYFMNMCDLDEINNKMFIIDVSCDTGMGFDFAISTTFANPIIHLTDNVDFYGIDHSPSIYYDTITTYISKIIGTYIPYVIDDDYCDNISQRLTLKNAIEICEGNIINVRIKNYQNRH